MSGGNLMDADTVFSIATAPKRDSYVWTPGEITWGGLLAWAAAPADHKECGGYLLGKLQGSRRTNSTVISRSAIVLDADNCSPDFIDKVLLLWPGALLVHSTYNHTLDDPHYHLVFPTDRDVTGEEHFQLAHLLMDHLGLSNFDPTCARPAQYMFKPAARVPAWYDWHELTGPPLPVAAWLPLWDSDLSNLPEPKVSRFKRDPGQLAGTPGAFNRAYTLAQVIEEFNLPYESSGGDRWHYIGAAGQAGMGPIHSAPGLVYSHHVSDPAGGQALSLYDLTRVHLYGELDADVKPGTPINRWPSSAEMLKMTETDKNVVREIVGVDFSDLANDEQEDDWRLKLTIDSRNGKIKDSIQNWDLIAENDLVLRSLYRNEMSMGVETDSDLPWRALQNPGPSIENADRSQLLNHLEREYGVRRSQVQVDNMIAEAAQQRIIHPVQDYLHALTWDGTPRVETCLPGVLATPYTRVVARKCLAAAVARVMDPGCKWDHTLVLYGAEGIGKSYWIEKLAKGWASSLGRIGDKDTLLYMQNSWILVSDEGHSLRKADADAQKEFLTRTSDILRLPYDKQSIVHPRRCVIWSTTNDEIFLRNQEGNRRFLIVDCVEKVDFSLITDSYIDQLWAEAVHLYTQGEPLFLSPEESALASRTRAGHTEEDVLIGYIEEYVNRPVPALWSEMPPDARRDWISAYENGMEAAGPAQVDTLCSTQIWVEAMGRALGDHRRIDLLEISKAIRKLPGWAAAGVQNLPGYGTQRAYKRVQESPESVL